MDLLETVLSAVKGGAGQQLASQFGLDTNQIGSVVTAVAPALANGLKDKLSSGGGGGIMELLNSGSLQKFADDPATIASPAASLDGQNILSQIFGGGDVLTGIISAVAEKTGVSVSVIQKILPVVTSLVMGVLAKSATRNSSGSIESEGLLQAVSALSGEHTGVFGALKGAASKLFG